jgi:hypothetical protein
MAKQAKSAVKEVKTVVEEKSGKQESKLQFKDLRKEYILRVTGPCELHIGQMIKWSKETKGTPKGSWLTISVLKGLDEEAVIVKKFLSTKGEKGFMWLAEAPIEEEAKQVVETA